MEESLNRHKYDFQCRCRRCCDHEVQLAAELELGARLEVSKSRLKKWIALHSGETSVRG